MARCDALQKPWIYASLKRRDIVVFRGGRADGKVHQIHQYSPVVHIPLMTLEGMQRMTYLDTGAWDEHGCRVFTPIGIARVSC